MITTVITSCNRKDLLERTLYSFFYHVGYHYKTLIERIIVIEDGEKPISSVYNDHVTYLATGKRVGQIEAIDYAYSRVKTEYILHYEEDWSTVNGGFLTPSLAILQEYPEVCMVGLRGLEDTMTQPVLKDRPYLYLDPTYKGHWHGFRFNPGLRRKSDWEKLGGYSSITKFNFDSPADSEIDIARAYYQMGMVAALLPEKFVEHIGRHRHVEAPKQMI